MPETPPRPRAPLAARAWTRRTTLALAPLVTLAGCRWGPAEDREVVTEQEQDADATLAATAATAIDAQLSRLTRATQAHPGAGAALAGLTAAHQAHLRLLPEPGASPSPTLSPTPGATTAPPPVSTSRAALAQVRAEEAALQAQLATLAGAAVSGPLARALASMSASVAQQLAAMPALPAEGPA